MIEVRPRDLVIRDQTPDVQRPCCILCGIWVCGECWDFSRNRANMAGWQSCPKCGGVEGFFRAVRHMRPHELPRRTPFVVPRIGKTMTDEEAWALQAESDDQLKSLRSEAIDEAEEEQRGCRYSCREDGVNHPECPTHGKEAQPVPKPCVRKDNHDPHTWRYKVDGKMKWCIGLFGVVSDAAQKAGLPTLQEEAKQRIYPFQDGDSTVIGPECFAVEDQGGAICWRGEWYFKAPPTKPSGEATVKQSGFNNRAARQEAMHHAVAAYAVAPHEWDLMKLAETIYGFLTKED